MNNFHTPVLLKEVIEGLKIKPGEKYIDATIGGGGHAFEILRLGGIVLGIDADKEAIGFVSGKWKIENRRWNIGEENLTLAHGNFRNIDKIARLNNLPAGRQGFNKAAGIIFDLGVSSHQIEKAERGFSFKKEGPLDMRMDKDLAVSARDIVSALNKGELYEIFSKLGEEGSSRIISDNIVRARSVGPIKTTLDLARLMGVNARPKVFQALRIAVNDELNALKEALPKALELIKIEGRLLVISFHSLEDRIVKESFIKFENEKKGRIITKKPIVPNDEELQRNRRARSAKLRIYEKT